MEFIPDDITKIIVICFFVPRIPLSLRLKIKVLDIENFDCDHFFQSS